jgi:hypothetical protein
MNCVCQKSHPKDTQEGGGLIPKFVFAQTKTMSLELSGTFVPTKYREPFHPGDSFGFVGI